MPLIQVELSLHLLLVWGEVVVVDEVSLHLLLLGGEVGVVDEVEVAGGQHQSQGSPRAPTNVQALPWVVLHPSRRCPPHHCPSTTTVCSSRGRTSV